MKKWKCDICGYIYDEEKGCRRNNIPANTPFEDVDANWVCPACQVGKHEFYLVENDE